MLGGWPICDFCRSTINDILRNQVVIKSVITQIVRIIQSQEEIEFKGVKNNLNIIYASTIPNKLYKQLPKNAFYGQRSNVSLNWKDVIYSEGQILHN